MMVVFALMSCGCDVAEHCGLWDSCIKQQVRRSYYRNFTPNALTAKY